MHLLRLSLCAARRMLWSFSRDGGVWLYRVWATVSKRTHTPVNAVWAMTALAFVMGLPMLWSDTAFQAIGSMSSMGLFISCEPS
jgi:amino acid transporter